ncbi:hypothetical protein [Cellulomonas hominis]
MNAITRITGTTIAAVLTVGALVGCSADTTPAPVETTPAEPEPVADEFSQVVDGVLYQGTEKAPVRIGTDAPGVAPALDAEIPVVTSAGNGWADQATRVLDAGRYVVCLTLHMNTANEVDGYQWEVIQYNDYGNAKVLEQGPVVSSIDEASVGPFTLDGRTLDRAESMLINLQ